MNDELLKQLPVKRIKAMDGLAVTADVWEESHDYHRQQQRFHALLHHSAGVLSGLQVIASDPPDSSVYIQPGVAVDPEGRLITLSAPTSYDVGKTLSGMVYLYLSYAESRPTLAEGGQDGSLMYVHAQFALEAAPSTPHSPVVELARIYRTDRNAVISNPKDREHPEPNSIDLRFRRAAGATARESAGVAVCYAGSTRDERHRRGADVLARMMRRADSTQVWVDDRVSLTAKLDHYALVYLVAAGAFQMSPDEMTGLYNYLQGGGTVLIESCRHDTQGAPPTDAALRDLLGSFGVKTADLPPGHELLSQPHLFAAPPSGFETQGAPRVTLSEGVVFSEADYGCLWQGERRGSAPTREDIRAALEWGENIVDYALRRRTTKAEKRTPSS